MTSLIELIDAEAAATHRRNEARKVFDVAEEAFRAACAELDAARSAVGKFQSGLLKERIAMLNDA